MSRKSTPLKLNATTVDPKTSNEYRFSIEYYIFIENGDYIAWSPSLDICTSGDSYIEAVANFYECFELYAEYWIEHGTLLDDLREHGWKVQNRQLKPPSQQTLMRKPKMKELYANNVSFERVVSPMRLSVQA